MLISQKYFDKLFSKGISKAILFCIFKILLKGILLKCFQNPFEEHFFYIFRILLKSFCPSLGRSEQ